MAEADGGVLLDVQVNPDEAAKEFDKLSKKAQGLTEKLVKSKQALALATNEALLLKEQLDAAKAKQAQMEASGRATTDQLTKQIETVNNLQAQFNTADQNAFRLSQSVDTINAELTATKEKAAEVAEVAKAGVLGTIEFARSKALSILGGFVTGIKNGISAGVKAAANLGGRIMAAAKRVKSLGGFADGLGAKFKKLGSTVKQIFVVGAIAKGLGSVRSALAQYLSVDTSLQKALGRLKGAFLTAFEPIYSVVVPALTTLLNTLTSVMGVAAQFIAALFGTTAKEAQSNAKSLEAQASATEDAGAAADKAGKSLASFDEINKIDTSSGNGSAGSGADVAALENAFDFEADASVFDSWGQTFLGLLTQIDNGIAGLKDAFGGFAEWFNGLNQKLYDMFTFPSVRDKVINIGNDLAGALNDLVSSIDWNLLGNALGAGLNLALLFLTNAIYGFDWVGIGGNLAQCINGIVSEIDWNAFGQWLWAGFKIGLETLAGFLLGLNMPEIANAASSIITGFLDSVYKAISNIDWGGIGRQITAFFVNINWKGIAESASKLIREFFQSLTEFITNIDWYALGQQVKEFLVNIDWAGIVHDLFTTIGAEFGAAAAFLWALIEAAWQNVVDWWHDKAFEDGKFTLEGLLKGILEVIANIGAWIVDNIFTPFIDGFKKAFGIASPSTVMAEQGGYIMAGLLNGVKEKLQPFLDFFNEVKGHVMDILNGIIQFVAGVFTGDWESAWDGVENVFKGIWNGIVSALEGAINLIIDGVNFLIAKVNNIGFDVPDWVPGIGGKTWGFNIPAIGKIQVPQLATGAVIPPNREFMAVLGDQSNGNNLEAPENLLRQIVREESGGDYTSLLQQILAAIKDGKILMVDDDVFARVVHETNERESSRQGMALVTAR